MPLAAGWDFAGGHALGSAVTYGVLVLVFLPVVRRSAQWGLVEVAALSVVVIGATRIALGVHGLTDVLGGGLLGRTVVGADQRGVPAMAERDRCT